MKCTSWLADYIINSTKSIPSPEWLSINQFLEQNDNGILCEASDKTHRVKAFITSEAIQNFEKKRDLFVRHIKGGLILCQEYSFESLYTFSFKTVLKIRCFDSPGGMSVAQTVDHLAILETPKKLKSEICHDVYHHFLHQTNNNKFDWMIQDFEEKILKEKEGWIEKDSFLNNTWKDSWNATPVEYPSIQHQISLSPPSKKCKFLSYENVPSTVMNQTHSSSKIQDNDDQSPNRFHTHRQSPDKFIRESENSELKEGMVILERDVNLHIRSTPGKAPGSTTKCDANSCEYSLYSPGILNNTLTVIESCSSADQTGNKEPSPTYNGTTRNENTKNINEMSYKLFSSLLDLAVADKPMSMSSIEPRAPKCTHKFNSTCSTCCYYFLCNAISDF